MTQPETRTYAIPGLSYRRGILVTLSLGWFLFNAGRFLLPPLAVPIQDALGIGNARFGFAITSLWGSYALLQYVAGVSTDTLGYKTVLVGAVGLVGLAFGVLSLTGAYPVFLVALVLVGTGGSFFYIVSRTMPAELYGDAMGQVIGLVTAAGNASGVLAPLVATVIVAYSWRAPFVAIGAGMLALVVVFHLLVRGRYTLEPPALRENSQGALSEVTKRGVPLMIFAYALFAISYQGTVAFMPLYFLQVKGFSLAVANSALSLFFLVGVFVKPASGWLSDTLGRRWVASGSIFGAGLVLGALALVLQSRLAVLAAVVLYGVTLLSFSPVMQAYLIEIFDDENNASSFGLARTMYVLVGSSGPTLVGIGSETIGFTTTFALVSGLLVLGAGVLLFTTHRLDVSGSSA